MTNEEKEFSFFNKALREKIIYHLGMNKGENVPLRKRTLTETEIEEEKIWGKENRNIKKGRLRVIRTENIAANVDAIRKIQYGMSHDTLTLVELYGLTMKKPADLVVKAIADILPHTTILCLNLGEMNISAHVLEYLLDKIKETTCILGAIFIEDISHELKKSFQKALAENRKKVEFLYRVSDDKRYSYLKDYKSAWWNLSSHPIAEWKNRYDRTRFESVQKTGYYFDKGFYYQVSESDDDEEANPVAKKKKK